jgi:hypothetical protein
VRDGWPSTNNNDQDQQTILAGCALLKRLSSAQKLLISMSKYLGYMEGTLAEERLETIARVANG